MDYSLSDLYIGITLAIFNSSGKTTSLIDRLIRYVSVAMYSFIDCFIIKAGIPSCPGAQLFNVDITVITSAALISCIHILFGLFCT